MTVKMKVFTRLVMSETREIQEMKTKRMLNEIIDDEPECACITNYNYTR